MRPFLAAFLIIALAVVAMGIKPVAGQEATPTADPPPAEESIPKVHIVVEGETLFGIAEQYGTTVEELQLLNGIDDASFLFLGQELLIPGATGDEVPVIYRVEIGDTLNGVAARFNTTVEEIAATNQLIHPDRLPAGTRLGFLSRTGSATPQSILGQPHVVGAGETLLSISARYGLSPAEIADLNELDYPARVYAGQRLRLPADTEFAFLPDEWLEVSLSPATLIPGDTLSVFVRNGQDGAPSGRLIGPEGAETELLFAPQEEGYVALTGLDAFAPPGTYTLALGGEGAVRPWYPFEQQFTVQPGDYTIQEIGIADQPDVRAEEDAFLATIFSQFLPEQLWNGLFQVPVADTVITARYGDGRSYLGGPVEIFHTGVDFGGDVGTPIIAPAAGTVAFVGDLSLRGTTVIVDHGLGVMSAYYHLSETNVEVNDQVVPSQIIGRGGNTGLSTGPHLHWDLRVNNIAVDPLRWTEVEFP